MSKTLKILISLVVVAWAVCALSGDATAATIGKLTGRVLDETGQPLPGANVVLEGTRRGATTDADGSYVILSIEPDVYRATASMVGYHSITKGEVIIRADFTTTVDFKLREEALELEEMVVVAERPPVEPDKTGSRYTVSSQDIRRTPILRDVSKFVALEAGVAVDGTGFLRGSAPDETSLLVDGIRLQQSDKRVYSSYGSRIYGWNTPGTVWWQGVNTDAVQEIAVITGGMNAEYGHAMSGVIQLVTRDGQQDYHGEAEYRLTPAGKKHWGANVYEAPELQGEAKWNDAEWVGEVDPATGNLVHQRTNYTDWRSHYVDGYLSGPIVPGASFFVSARHQRDAAILPGPWERRPPNIRTTAKATAEVGSNAKLRAGWIYDYSEYWRSGRTATWGNISNVVRGTGRALFIPEGSPGGKVPTSENVIYATWTHTINPKTFYEIRVSRYVSKEDSSETTGMSTSDLKTDKAGYFYLGRETMWNYTIAEQKRTTLKADLSSQVSKGHFFKTGVEYVRYSNWFIYEALMPNKDKHIEFVGDKGVPGDPITPSTLGVYVQDKMEFEGLIVNVGLRYDRFWGANGALFGAFRSWMYNSLSRFQQIPYYRLKPSTAWAPRLGISHPITDRSALHFNYGHFIQLAGFRRMFQEMWETAGSVAVPGVPYSEYTYVRWPGGSSALFNQFHKMQQKINVEVGADWNFVDDYVVTLATFYNSGTFQESGGWVTMYDPILKTRLWGGSTTGATWWEDSRGFEFSLRKAFSHHFSFRAGLNIEWHGQMYAGTGYAAMGAGIAFDSTFIMTSPILVDWKEEGGSQVPVPWTEEKRRETVGGALTVEQVSANPLLLVYGTKDIGHEMSERGGLPDEVLPDAQGIIYTEDHYGGGTRTSYTQGRYGQASLQTFFSSPPDLGGGPKFAGSTLLGDLRANLIYTIYTGSKFSYPTLVEGKSKDTRGPLHTNADLSVLKRLSFGRVNADLFLEVTNLFNQKDAGASGLHYMYFGLQGPAPDDATYLQYGDTSDRSRYQGSPRVTHVGMRLSF